MAYKNKLYAFALLAISPLSMAQDWNGTVLGFEAPPEPVLGEMLGKVRISRSF
ncbi:TPA: carbohydrate porin, partial [Enterobacter roggenkampii]